MKRSYALLSVLFVFTLTSCGGGQIASVDDHSTYYQYEVSEILLIDASTGKELDSEKVEDYYYFSTAKDLCQANITSAHDFFDGIESTGDYLYSKEHDRSVKILLVLDGVDEVYAPSFDVDGELVTVEYYSFGGSVSNNVYNKIYSYDEAQEMYREYQEQVRGLEFDSDEYKDIDEKYEEMTEDSIVIIKNSYTTSASGLNVRYVAE